jgi:hypothetical protein
MCTFEEEIIFLKTKITHVIKVLFTGRWIVICAIHRWIILFGQINKTLIYLIFGNNTLIVLSVPTIFLGAASENSWYLGDNNSAITLIPRQ